VKKEKVKHTTPSVNNTDDSNGQKKTRVKKEKIKHTTPSVNNTDDSNEQKK